MQSMPSTHKGIIVSRFFSDQNKSKLNFTDFPNQCYVESEGKGFSVGEHTPIGICKKIICASNFSYEIHG